jgi:sigma-B regulation protein RsbU (phosphoserine phosphatase)
VSGDFFDFVTFRDGSLALIIGDVTDKGMPAALFMASARSVVRGSIAAAYEPVLAVEQANAALAADAPNGMFVTLLAARLTHNHGTVHIVNAGNHRPILYRAAAGDLTEVGRPGLPLAIDPALPYRAAEELLLAGDFLLLHTDGLTDATNAAQDLFGIDRVRQVLMEHRTSSAGELRDHLRAAVASFMGSVPPYDDVTFLIARRTT